MTGFQPPDAPLSRGLEVHPGGSADELEIWVDRAIVPAGYGWSFPADDEVRVGVGSFDPRFHVKEPTVDLARQLQRDAVRYQGNWIPHRLRPATEGGVFFAGDSAGHCLPLTAEGIRTALYFGIALGRELRDVVEGRSTRETALASLRGFLRRARMEVPLDAARAARRSARAAPGAGACQPCDGHTCLYALGVRSLPRRRAAGLRDGPAWPTRAGTAACGCGLSPIFGLNGRRRGTLIPAADAGRSTGRGFK